MLSEKLQQLPSTTYDFSLLTDVDKFNNDLEDYINVIKGGEKLVYFKCEEFPTMEIYVLDSFKTNKYEYEDLRFLVDGYIEFTTYGLQLDGVQYCFMGNEEGAFIKSEQPNVAFNLALNRMWPSKEFIVLYGSFIMGTEKAMRDPSDAL
jgi:hypothetical protein